MSVSGCLRTGDHDHSQPRRWLENANSTHYRPGSARIENSCHVPALRRHPDPRYPGSTRTLTCSVSASPLSSPSDDVVAGHPDRVAAQLQANQGSTTSGRRGLYTRGCAHPRDRHQPFETKVILFGGTKAAFTASSNEACRRIPSCRPPPRLQDSSPFSH